MGCSKCGKRGHNKLQCNTRIPHCSQCKQTGHNKATCKNPPIKKLPKKPVKQEEMLWDKETQKLRRGETSFPDKIIQCIEDLETNDSLTVTKAAEKYQLDYYDLIYYLYHYDPLWLNILMKRTWQQVKEDSRQRAVEPLIRKYPAPKLHRLPAGGGYLKTSALYYPFMEESSRIGFINVEEDKLIQLKKIYNKLKTTQLNNILDHDSLIELSMEILDKLTEDKPGYRKPFEPFDFTV